VEIGRRVLHFVQENGDGSYTVGTQQCVGAMRANLAAMGRFPAVDVADVPARCTTTAARFPIEIGQHVT
jgi:hypothetical protein